jgi:hypothetical protein
MIAMTKLSALMAARFRGPRSFAIAMSLAAAAALTACAGGGNFLQQEGGTSAADGAAYTPRTP